MRLTFLLILVSIYFAIIGAPPPPPLPAPHSQRSVLGRLANSPRLGSLRSRLANLLRLGSTSSNNGESSIANDPAEKETCTLCIGEGGSIYILQFH